VRTIKDISTRFKQRPKTFHYAITFLDLVLTKRPTIFSTKFDDQKFFKTKVSSLTMNKNILATSCILLASKFYELDENLILSTDVRRKFGRSMFTQNEFDRAELQVLEILDWNLLRLTVLDFVQVITSLGLIQNDDQIEGEKYEDMSQSEKQEIADKMVRLTTKLTDWVLLSYRPNICSFKKSELAVAVMIIARKLMGLSNE